VLDVPPRQRRTGKKKKRHECTITTLVKGKFLISFTWLPKRERIRQQLPVRLPKFPNAFSCIYRTSRWWPVLSSRNLFFIIKYIFLFLLRSCTTQVSLEPFSTSKKISR
jgi:hypothetical protein